MICMILMVAMILIYFHVDLKGKAGEQRGRGATITGSSVLLAQSVCSASTVCSASSPNDVLLMTLLMKAIESFQRKKMRKKYNRQNSEGKNQVPNLTLLALPCHKSIF